MTDCREYYMSADSKSLSPPQHKEVNDVSATVADAHMPAEAKPRVCGYCKAEIRTSGQAQAFFEKIKQLGDTIQANPEWAFAGIYADRVGREDSPFAPRHPRLDQLLADCGNGIQANHINRVVTPSMAHFGEMLPTVLRTLTARGIAVTFLKEGFDTATGDGEMLLAVISSREERALIRERPIPVREAAPRDKVIGYRRVGRTLTVDSGEAEIVRRVFRECLAGNGVLKIVKILEDEGIPTVAGRAVWAQKTILDMLRNERYCGERTAYGAEREALVSREDWERAQMLLKERLNPSGGVRAPAKLHPYTGIAVCGYCGKSMVHAFMFGSGRWHKDVYICGAHHRRASWCPKARYYSEVCIGQLLDEACKRYREEQTTNSYDSRLSEVKAAVFFGDECTVHFGDGYIVKLPVPRRLVWTATEATDE